MPGPFVRGFVESVTCTAADWLAHADAIRAAQPVTKVRLTMYPGMDVSGDGVTTLVYTVRGIPGEFDLHVLRTVLGLLGSPPRALWADEVTLGVFTCRYPGITFHLPPLEPEVVPIDLGQLVESNYLQMHAAFLNAVIRGLALPPAMPSPRITITHHTT